MNKYFAVPLSALCFLISCASPPVRQDRAGNSRDSAEKAGNTTQILLRRREEIKNLSLDTRLNFNNGSSTNSASCSIEIAGVDSLGMTVQGPFGILVGRLFAVPNYFVFYDALHDELFEGVPNAESIYRILQIPLSYGDIVRLLRGEVPGNMDEFTSYPARDQAATAVFAAGQDSLTSYVAVSRDNGMLLNYQKKVVSGPILMDVNYRNFEARPEILFPGLITFSFPQRRTELSFEMQNVSINKTTNKRLSFSIPEGVKRTRVQ